MFGIGITHGLEAVCLDKYLSSKKNIAMFVLPAFLIFFLIAIVPLLVSAYYSLFEYNGVGAKTFIQVKNYIDLFTDKKFIRATQNASIMMAASLFIQLPISFLLALTLSRGVPGEKTFRTIYFVPVLISSMVIGQLFINIFNSQYGLLNGVISYFIPDYHFAWLTSSKTAYFSTVVPQVWQYIGYHMLILYAGMKSISTDYYEAAKIDGATGFKATMKITIPLMAPVIKTCTVFAIVGSIKAFDMVFIMTNGGPNNISHVPATLMYNNLFKRSLYGYGSAQSFMIVLECLILSWIVSMLFKKAEDNASL